MLVRQGSNLDLHTRKMRATFANREWLLFKLAQFCKWLF